MGICYAELLDLMAIEQVKHEGAKLSSAVSEEDKFWKMMSVR